MECLPYEVLETIFSFLPLADQKSMKLTCRRFYYTLSRPRFISSHYYVMRTKIESAKFLFAENIPDELDVLNPDNQDCHGSSQCGGCSYSSMNHSASSSNSSPKINVSITFLGRFVTSISFQNRYLNPSSLSQFLRSCVNLRQLDISGCNLLFDVQRLTDGREYFFLSDGVERALLNKSVGQSLQRLSLANVTSLRDENVKHILNTFPHVNDFDFSGCLMDSSASFHEAGARDVITHPQLSFRNLLSELHALSVDCYGGTPLCVTLRLNCTGITDRDLDTLCSCNFLHLRGLSIDNCRNLTHHGLRALLSSVHSIGYLEEFSMALPSPELDSPTLLQILKVFGPNLKRLTLSKLPITSKTQLTSLIACCSNVVHLDISSCCMKFSGWSEYLWMNLHCITSLDISGHFTLTDEDISVMSLSLRNRLKYLNISSCMKLTDLSLEVICINFSSSLEVLNANWCKGFSDIGVLGTTEAPLFGAGIYSFTRLRELNLSDCHQITKRSFTFQSPLDIPHFGSLIRLQLGRIGPLPTNTLVDLCCFAPVLQSLDVSRSAMDDGSLNVILEKLQHTLRQLYLSGCESLTNLALDSLLFYIPYLRVLDISFCPHISQDALKSFQGRMVYLTELKALYVGTALTKNVPDTGS